MTLLELRKTFVHLSGRYDLVVDTADYADSGANFFLQAGQRMLDKMVASNDSLGRQSFTTSYGVAEYELPRVLSLKKVQVSSDDSGVVDLTQVEEGAVPASLDPAAKGLPLFYSVFSSIRSPLLGDRQEGMASLVLKLYATPDASYEITISGRFAQQLVSDTDITWWSVNSPETLLRAAMYQIETFHRNSQGASDHMRAIMIELREMDFNAIESVIGDRTQMNDSFYFRGEGNAR